MIDSMPAKLSRAISAPGRSGADLDEMKRLLLAEPDLVNQVDPWENYPLTNAALQGNVEAVQLLLAAGAKVNAVHEGKTALHQVACHADTSAGKPAEVVKMLIAAGAEVNARDEDSFTPLRWAVTDRKKVNLEIVKSLITAGADVNAAGKFVNVLMVASSQASPEIVRALIAAGANVNAVMRLGTPLSQAAAANRADNVTVLLESGANANFRFPADFEKPDLAGKTALDVARGNKAKKVIALLEGAASQHGKPGATEKPAATARIVSVADSWKKIDAWLKANNPALKKTVNKPATDKQIAALEAIIGAKLPADFNESLKIHNGQKYSAGDLIPPLEDGDAAYFLMASADIAEEWQNRKKLHDSREFADKESGPDKGIQSAWWHPGWIPFASNGGGDSLCLDLAPTPDGKTGQVITMNHESAKRELLAASFAQWLADLAERVEKGALQQN